MRMEVDECASCMSSSLNPPENMLNGDYHHHDYAAKMAYALCSPPIQRNNSRLRHSSSARSDFDNGVIVESPSKKQPIRHTYHHRPGFDEPRKKLQDMPVSVKVYYGTGPNNEIRRFTFRPEQYQKHVGHYAILNSAIPQNPGSSQGHLHGSGRCQPSCSAYTVSPGDCSPQQPMGVFDALVDRINALFNHTLIMQNVHFCWKDDDGDYVIFSSDDELRVAINNTTDNTLRIYIRDREVNKVGLHKLKAEQFNDSNDSRNTEVHFNERLSFRGSDRFVAADLVEHDGIQQVRYQRDSSGDRRSRRGVRPPVNATVVTQQPSGSSQQHRQSSDLSLEDDEVIVSLTNHMSAPPTLNLQDCNGGINLCSHCHGEAKGASRAGVWYKCTVCNDYYLCSECENKGLHDQHIMVRTTVGHSPTPTVHSRKTPSPLVTPSSNEK